MKTKREVMRQFAVFLLAYVFKIITLTLQITLEAATKNNICFALRVSDIVQRLLLDFVPIIFMLYFDHKNLK